MQGVAEVGSTANKYEILAKLATGGMAEIFLARGASVADVERYVVLKRILRDRANDAHFVQMFLEEARLAAQLNHPNVAQVFDIGKLGDSYFFTMEYVHGETVRNLLHRARSLRREIPLGCILTVIAAAAAGLHHAHDRLGFDGRPLGIVHRDVSPSNLMISYEGSVKVVDFGVAKADNRAHETQSGAVKGKISYLSPEQIGGSIVDRRSDLFALGIVLWEMLTTERLYRRASDFENMNAIVNEQPELPSRWRQSLPRELDEMTVRLLSKRPEQRYQSGDELVEAIEGLASRVGAQLSAAALGRFMRELFGQRPEPWHEVEFRDAAPDGVTVTNEPIPPELLPIDPVELELAQVRDLSRQYAAVGSASADPGTPVPPRPSTDAFPVDDLDTMKTIGRQGIQRVDVMKTLQEKSPELFAAMHVKVEARPTIPMHGISPPPVRMTPPAPIAVVPAPQPPLPAPRAPGPPGPVRHRPMVAAMPLVVHAPPAPDVKSQRGLVVAIAALVGVAGTITGIMLLSSDKPAAVEPTPPAPPAVVQMAPAIEAPPPVVVDKPADNRRHGDKIAAAFDAAQLGEVLALCGVDVDDRAHVCAVASCRGSDEPGARGFLAKVTEPSNRTAALAGCKDAGIDLAPPPPRVKPAASPTKSVTPPTPPTPPAVKPTPPTPPVTKPEPATDCASDPMACQH